MHSLPLYTQEWKMETRKWKLLKKILYNIFNVSGNTKFVYEFSSDDLQDL